uniref:Uncharacterized protein n=1 Tax=Arundo donax TaxID=35708 RepID=A0A0A9I0E1_ARUDO
MKVSHSHFTRRSPVLIQNSNFFSHSRNSQQKPFNLIIHQLHSSIKKLSIP